MVVVVVIVTLTAILLGVGSLIGLPIAYIACNERQDITETPEEAKERREREERREKFLRASGYWTDEEYLVLEPVVDKDLVPFLNEETRKRYGYKPVET